MLQQLLEGGPQVLSSLVSLDVSGRKRLNEAAVGAFVDSPEWVGIYWPARHWTQLLSCPFITKNLKVSTCFWHAACGFIGGNLTPAVSSWLKVVFVYFLNMRSVFSAALTLLICGVCAQVTGEANEDQVHEVLRKYIERECFVREALLHLYSLTVDTEKPQPDMLKVMLLSFYTQHSSSHISLLLIHFFFSVRARPQHRSL